jgi:flagella synthesis protein FlgN
MSVTSPIATLHEEQQVMQQLRDVLEQEQRYLMKAVIDKLEDLAAQKSALVTRMAQLSSERHGALAAAGFPAREEGMESWLAVSTEADAADLWRAVLKLTREAKELNRLNGMLINKQMAYTQGALNALRPMPQSGQIYGRSGQTSAGGASRRFVVG